MVSIMNNSSYIKCITAKYLADIVNIELGSSIAITFSVSCVEST